MKNKPQIHFWIEAIDEHVRAVHCCRSWDVPANGVFLLMTVDEMRRTKETGWRPSVDWYELLQRKLENRERHLFNWHGRALRHHLADMNLLPPEIDEAREHQRRRTSTES